MKKTVVYAMIAIMGFSVAGCGSNTESSVDDKQQEVQTTEKDTQEESQI